MAAAGGKPSEVAAVCEYGAADCGVAVAGRVEVARLADERLTKTGGGAGRVSLESLEPG